MICYTEAGLQENLEFSNRSRCLSSFNSEPIKYPEPKMRASPPKNFKINTMQSITNTILPGFV